MRSLHLKLRVPVVIESNRSPQRRLMTLLTFISKPTFVDVIALVAFRTCHRGILESRRQMTVLASRRPMTAR